MSITINGATNTLTAASGLTIAGNTAVTGTLSASGVTSVTDTTDATSTTAASLKTAGGLGVAKKTYCGDNIVMSSGKGIDFSATSDGSGTTTSEVLSDYEEGTFTPTITFATAGDLSVSYATQAGKYTKVGRQVTVAINISTSAFSYTTASGILRVGGLPFVDDLTQAVGACAMRGWTSAGFTQTTIRGSAAGASYFYITKSGSGQTPAVLQTGEVPSGGTVDIDATITYFV